MMEANMPKKRYCRLHSFQIITRQHKITVFNWLDCLLWHCPVYMIAKLGSVSDADLYWTCINKQESSQRCVLAILDDQAVIIHLHSVKGWNQSLVVMRTRTRRRGIWMSTKRRNAIWCQPESAMFCAHLSHFGYAVQLLPEKWLSYRACDEEMSKPLHVLTLLKIISLISMVYQFYRYCYHINSCI